MDSKSYEENLEIENKSKALGYDVNIISTFGIHPQKVLEADKNLSIYNELCNNSPIIGEIGMDFCWYKDASRIEQEKVFRYFMEHCNKTKKYCVIHTKDAEKEICEILKDYPDSKPIIHWYDGPKKYYEEFINRDYYFTFGCETIRSKHIQELLKITPEDRILLETDNPSSEPWLGGTDNSVFLIKRIYKDIAKIQMKSEEKIAKIVLENCKRIFNESGIII